MNLKSRFIQITLFFVATSSVAAQDADDDSLQLRDIYKTSLTNGKSYQWLDYLSNEIGGRLSGSL
ncbi:MAG: peptidase M28 family protein, partial [Bacteroidota bacterium]|nr:peptidase M28 family protein [Bacteroidota bacterium]